MFKAANNFCTSALGWRYELAKPLLATAVCGATVRKNGLLLLDLLPWCAKIRMLLFSFSSYFSISCASVVLLMSPVSSRA